MLLALLCCLASPVSFSLSSSYFYSLHFSTILTLSFVPSFTVGFIPSDSNLFFFFSLVIMGLVCNPPRPGEESYERFSKVRTPTAIRLSRYTQNFNFRTLTLKMHSVLKRQARCASLYGMIVRGSLGVVELMRTLPSHLSPALLFIPCFSKIYEGGQKIL